VIGLWLAICIIPIITSSEISGFCDTVAASPEHCTRQAISYRQRRARELCVCVLKDTRHVRIGNNEACTRVAASLSPNKGHECVPCPEKGRDGVRILLCVGWK
jgi:hypothetical protein